MLAPEINGGNIVSIELIVIGEPRSAPEGTWVIGGEADKKLKLEQCLEKHRCN